MWGHKMKKNSYLYDLGVIAIGNFILALGVNFFFIPNDILAGGVAGIAIALEPIFHIPVQSMITIIIAIAFIIGLVFLGKEFALKTMASSILYPVFIYLLQGIPLVKVDPILASIYGGLVSGIGIGIVFRVGSSTGGMDIPPLVLAKYTKIKVHTWMIIVDAITILLGISTFGLNAALIGLISAFTLSKTVSVVQTFGGDKALQVFIITDAVDEIMQHILVGLDRGATIIHGKGGYTKEPREIIMTVLMTEQYARLEKMVKEIDKGAFLIVSDVTEVHGDGFFEY
jgi:uncharacterized membrane-anchored protein YitT (DUF2179 family)